MDKLFDETMKFMQGKLELEEYMGKIYSLSQQLEKMISGSGEEALSFYESGKQGLSYIREAYDEDNKLRLKSLICDISNNFAHALEVKGRRNAAQSTDYYTGVFYGIKQGMAFEIIRECKVIKNKSYGMTLDGRGDPVFAVDIPMCGQVSWHFPTNRKIKSKDYDFELEKKNIHITNMKLLCEGVKKEEYDMLSSHSKKVIDSQDIQEMNETLYQRRDTLDLSDLVNKEPTQEEIDMLNENQEQLIETKTVSIDIIE